MKNSVKILMLASAIFFNVSLQAVYYYGESQSNYYNDPMDQTFPSSNTNFNTSYPTNPTTIEDRDTTPNYNLRSNTHYYNTYPNSNFQNTNTNSRFQNSSYSNPNANLYSNGNATASKSDETIIDRIRVALKNDQFLSIDGRNVRIEVANGKVTLSGQVPNTTEKVRIEFITKQVSGVSGVTNNIEVNR